MKTLFRTRQNFVFALTLLVSGYAGSTQAALENGKWHRYTSSNFEVYSKLKEKVVAERIKDLEAFRAVVHLITGIKDKGNYNHTTKLMLLPTQSQIQTVYKIPNASGFMRPGLRSNLMVIGKHHKRNLLSSANEIAFHEYVHYLVRNATSFNYPTWYDEGFADLFSATEFKEDHARIGVIPKKSAYSILEQRRMALADVLPVKSTRSLPKKKILPFYAQSWLLVHYLQLSDQANSENLRQKTNEFLKQYNQGAEPKKAFVEVFGMSLKSFDRELKAYEKLNLPSYGIPLEKLNYDKSYKKVGLSEDEITYEIAYQVITTNPTYARKLFKRILKASPTDARAMAGLGVTWQMEMDYTRARTWMKKALQLAPDDYILHIEMADLINVACSPSEWTKCGWNQPRQTYSQHSQTAYRLAPELLETKVGYSQTLNLLDRGDEVLPIAQSAYALAPWNLQVIILLGLAEVSSGQLDRGEKTLNRALGWSGETPEVQEEIRQALMQLEMLRLGQKKPTEVEPAQDEQ